MKIFISTYNNFRLKQIPENIMCIGVSKEIPEDFQTTSMHNFLYTPKNILGGTYSDIIEPNVFIEKYKEHVQNMVKKFGYSSLQDYFTKMMNAFDNGDCRGICFLDDSIAHWYDVAVILKDVLKELGFEVEEFSKHKNIDDNSLF